MLHKKNFNWGPALFLILYQVILAITLPFYFYYFSVKISTAVISIILLFITGISITGGTTAIMPTRAIRQTALWNFSFCCSAR